MYGGVIKQRRIERGYTQGQLAALIGCTAQHVCDIEHDRRGMSYALAAAMEITLGVSTSKTWSERAATVIAAIAHPGERRYWRCINQQWVCGFCKAPMGGGLGRHVDDCIILEMRSLLEEERA